LPGFFIATASAFCFLPAAFVVSWPYSSNMCTNECKVLLLAEADCRHRRRSRSSRHFRRARGIFSWEAGKKCEKEKKNVGPSASFVFVAFADKRLSGPEGSE